MKRVVATRHAIEQAGRRFCELEPGVNVAELIIDEVADALRAGRVLDHQPPHFRLYGRKNGNLPAGQRFYYDESERRGYIVVTEEHCHVVITSLSRTGVSSRAERRSTKERRVA